MCCINDTYSYKEEILYLFRSYEQGLVLYAATARKDDPAHFQPLLEYCQFHVIRNTGEFMELDSHLKKCSLLSGRMHRWINLDSTPIWLRCSLLSRMRRIKSAWKNRRCERKTIEYEKGVSWSGPYFKGGGGGDEWENSSWARKLKLWRRRRSSEKNDAERWCMPSWRGFWKFWRLKSSSLRLTRYMRSRRRTIYA